MAWNEPPGNGQDPWGNKKRPKQDGPPDLDEVFRDLSKQFNKLFGKKGGGNGPAGNGSSGGSAGAGLLWGAVGILLLVFLAFNSVYTIGEQEKGVVSRLGKYQATEPAGLRWKVPLIDTVEIVNVTRLREHSYNSTMLTKDENIVKVSLSVQYSVSSARDFVLNVRAPMVSLEQSAESALRHEVGSRTLEEVLVSGRVALSKDIEDRLRGFMDSYETGVQISVVNVEETAAPAQVQEAFADVVKAREDQQRLKNEAESYKNQVVPVARGEAERITQDALGYKARKIESATGEADRFTALLTEYQENPEITRQRLYIEAVSDVYSNTTKVLMGAKGEGNDSVLYLPLDRLTNKAAGQ